MAKSKDVFGFDEFNKALEKMKGKYKSESAAVLMAQGKQVNARVKQLTPTYKGNTAKYHRSSPGRLKKSFRLKPIKFYKSSKVAVVRVQTEDPISHLIEFGHKSFSGGKGKVSKLSVKDRTAKGIKQHGDVSGVKMIERAFKEAESRFSKSADEMVKIITEEVSL